MIQYVFFSRCFVNTCHFNVARFNKLGLDTITTGEEPNPSNQVEEVNSYRPVRSEPLCSEKIVHLDIGTAHSVAVTGEIFTPLIWSVYLFLHFHKKKTRKTPLFICRFCTRLRQTFLDRKGSVFHLWQQPTWADRLQVSPEQPGSVPGARPPGHHDGCLWRRFHFSYWIRWVGPIDAN